MINIQSRLSFFILGFIGLIAAGCSLLTPPPVINIAPKIESIVINPESPYVDSEVTLTCNANDPDGDSISFSWEVNGGTISDPSSATTTWTTPEDPGEVVITLTISDGSEQTIRTRTVDVLDVNHPPVANAGNDGESRKDIQYTLVGNATDSDGDTLSYQWEFHSVNGIPAGSQLVNADIIDADKSTARFTPDVLGTFVFVLTASDGIESHSDQVNIVCKQNLSPVISIENGATEVTLKRTALGLPLVTLTATAEDPDGDTLKTPLWVLNSIPDGSTLLNSNINNSNSLICNFQPDKLGDYSLKLAIADSYDNTGEKNITVHVLENAAPQAIVEEISDVLYVNQQFTVDGRSSNDSEGDAITYNWSVTEKPSGATLTFTNPLIARTSVTGDKYGNYTLQLTASDWNDSSSATLDLELISNPGIPAHFTATTGSSVSTINLGWDSDDQALSFNLYWSDHSGVNSSSEKISGLTGSSYTFNAQSGYTDYYFKLTAVRSDGSETSESSEITAISAGGLPENPTLRSLNGPESSSFYDMTISPDGSTLYMLNKNDEIFKSTDSGANWALFYSLPFAAHYLDRISLAASDDYLFVARANSNDESLSGVFKISESTAAMTEFTLMNASTDNYVTDGANYERWTLVYSGSRLYLSITNTVYWANDFSGNGNWAALSSNSLPTDIGASTGGTIFYLTADENANGNDGAYVFAYYSDCDHICGISVDNDPATMSTWFKVGAAMDAGVIPQTLSYLEAFDNKLLVLGTKAENADYDFEMSIFGLILNNGETPEADWNDSTNWTEYSLENPVVDSLCSFAYSTSVYISSDRGDCYSLNYLGTHFDKVSSNTLSTGDYSHLAINTNFMFRSNNRGFFRKGLSASSKWEFGGMPAEAQIFDMVEWQGKMAIAYDKGVSFFDPSNEMFSTPVLPDLWPSDLLVYQNSLYIITSGGYYRMDSPDSTPVQIYSDRVLLQVCDENFLYVYVDDNSSTSFIKRSASVELSSASLDFNIENFGESVIHDNLIYINDCTDDNHIILNLDDNSWTTLTYNGASRFRFYEDRIYGVACSGGGVGLVGYYDPSGITSIFTAISNAWEPSDTGAYGLEFDGKYIYSFMNNGKVYRCLPDGSSHQIYAEGVDTDILFSWSNTNPYSPSMQMLFMQGVMYLGTEKGSIFILE